MALQRSSSLAHIQVTGGDFIDHPRNAYANGAFRLIARDGRRLTRVYLSLAEHGLDLRILRHNPISPTGSGVGGALRGAAIGAILGGRIGAIGGAILGASAAIKGAQRTNRALKGKRQSFVARFRGGYSLEGEMDSRTLAQAQLRFLRSRARRD